MKMRQSLFGSVIGWTPIVVVLIGVCCGLPLQAQSALLLEDQSLVCENTYFPPLFAFDLPCYAQVLKCHVSVFTDAGSVKGSHTIVVRNQVLPYPDVHLFLININQDGSVTSKDPFNSYFISYGQSPTSKSQGYYATQIGEYDIAGNDFPLSAWVGDPNWKAPPTFSDWFFNLDAGASNWKPMPENSKEIFVTSKYQYTQWAWGSFLGFELPYLPAATQPPDKNIEVDFDMRKLKPAQSPYSTTADNSDPADPKKKPKKPKKTGPAGTGPNDASNSPQSPTSPGCGMAVASLDRFQAGTALFDTPIRYNPALGMNMTFSLSYHQRQTNLPSTSICSNLGTQWQCNWISYITGGPTNSQGDATYYAPGGNQYAFKGYNPTIAQGISATVVNQGDFQDSEGWTNASLHYRQNPERYELWEPDGTILKFAQPITTSSGKLFFLSLIIDPQGLVTTLNYDPNAAVNGQARVTSVTDPLGGQLVFSYNTENPLQISKVTRSCDGLAANFQYSNGLLSSITDPVGITSSFQYAQGTAFITQMTTPYGTTTFNSSDGATYLEADMTNPLGQTERVEYQESLPTSDISDYGAAVPSNSNLATDPSTLNQANTFYWDRRAMSDAAAGGVALDTPAFYALAQVTHWAEGGEGSIAIPLSIKTRLEGRIWFNYLNQPDADHVITNASGTTTSPSVVARLLDNGTTQVSLANYNSNGLITQSVDPLGRTTNYTYAANGIDLTQVTQVNGSGQDILSQMTYNSLHEPLTITDASGQTTTMTYNPIGQILTMTDALNETTTLAYNSDYFLQSVTGPVSGATTSYTYTPAGLVQTVTDSEGYTMTNAYDNLDRLTSVTYPDGTSDQVIYQNLDVIKTIDRQGRAPTSTYDAIREILNTTDPLGRTTKYTWCTCGGLSTLTDANGNVTTWGLDGEGRITAKTYADGTAIHYVYETNTSRVHSLTDPRGSVTTYTNNNDNTIASIAYTAGSGVAATPNVSFTYDPVYNRLSTMTDGVGTTSYTYNPVNGQIGSNRLARVSVPVAGTGQQSVTTYQYDALGRVVGKNIDGNNGSSVAFDSLGRVTGVTNLLGSFAYAYVNTPNPSARLASVTYPSGTGLSANYSYFGNTGDQRLQEIKNLKNGAIMSDFQYTYNPVGTIATWQRQTDSNTPTQYALTYDAADQLTDAEQVNTGTSGTVTSNKYNYDPAGNRLAETTLTGTTAGQFNNLNQLAALSGAPVTTTVGGYTSAPANSVTVNAVPATVSQATNFTANVPLLSGTNLISIVAQPSGTNSLVTTQRVQMVLSGTAPTQLTYDVNGNTTTDENGNAYTWDAENRLISITYSSGASTSFAYDGFSRRVQIIEKNSSGSVTSTKNFIWCGSSMCEERDASNNVTKRFYGQGEQIARTSYFFSRDHLGSIREMTDSSGNIISRLDYDPAGRTTAVSGTTLPDFGFDGMYWHQPSNDYQTLWRIYDPNTFRWLSHDPLEEGSDATLYSFVWNNSVVLVDPLGLNGRNFSGGPSDGGAAANANAQATIDSAEAKAEANAFYFIDSFSVQNMVGHPSRTVMEVGVAKPLEIWGLHLGTKSPYYCVAATSKALGTALPFLGGGAMIGATVYDFAEAPQPPPYIYYDDGQIDSADRPYDPNGNANPAP